MQIFICEDDVKYRNLLESVIKSYVLIEDYAMQLSLSTESPDELLEFLESQVDIGGSSKFKGNLYFLDVDLQHEEMNGITLASKIKFLEPEAKIVFITSHTDFAHLSFRYKIEALDYITKDEFDIVSMRIKECIDTAYRRHLSNRSPVYGGFHVKIKNINRLVSYSSIMFFESNLSPHRVLLHTENDHIEFFGALTAIMNDLNSDFFRSHKSFIVNIKNVKHVNSSTRQIEMVNGEIALVSFRKLKPLIEAMRG